MNLLTSAILPACQYFAYLEVGDESGLRAEIVAQRETTLWQTYQTVRKTGADIAMRRVSQRRDFYPVFRELFQRRPAGAES